MTISDDLINLAPSFRDLLEAIMDEKRNNIKNTDTYKYIECTIKEKCEEAALDLRCSILLGELGLINNSLFKSMKYHFSTTMLLDSITYICKNLDLDFDGKKISWGGHLPKE